MQYLVSSFLCSFFFFFFFVDHCSSFCPFNLAIVLFVLRYLRLLITLYAYSNFSWKSHRRKPYLEHQSKIDQTSVLETMHLKFLTDRRIRSIDEKSRPFRLTTFKCFECALILYPELSFPLRSTLSLSMSILLDFWQI